MKILHTADWHIGQLFHQYDRTWEHQQFLNWLVHTLRDEQIDVLLISGDRHLAELAALPAGGSEGVGYGLYEATSSSLNAPSGNFTKLGVRFANEINPYRVGLTWFDTNYGNILVDWSAADPVIRVQICDQSGAVVLQQRLLLSQLRRGGG